MPPFKSILLIVILVATGLSVKGQSKTYVVHSELRGYDSYFINHKNNAVVEVRIEMSNNTTQTISLSSNNENDMPIVSSRDYTFSSEAIPTRIELYTKWDYFEGYPMYNGGVSGGEITSSENYSLGDDKKYISTVLNANGFTNHSLVQYEFVIDCPILIEDISFLESHKDTLTTNDDYACKKDILITTSPYFSVGASRSSILLWGEQELRSSYFEIASHIDPNGDTIIINYEDIKENLIRGQHQTLVFKTHKPRAYGSGSALEIGYTSTLYYFSIYNGEEVHMEIDPAEISNSILKIPATNEHDLNVTLSDIASDQGTNIAPVQKDNIENGFYVISSSNFNNNISFQKTTFGLKVEQPPMEESLTCPLETNINLPEVSFEFYRELPNKTIHMPRLGGQATIYLNYENCINEPNSECFELKINNQVLDNSQIKFDFSEKTIISPGNNGAEDTEIIVYDGYLTFSLAAGNHNLEILSDKNDDYCLPVKIPLQINAPDPIVVGDTIINTIPCNSESYEGTKTGSVTFSKITGGLGDYYYLKSGPGNPTRYPIEADSVAIDNLERDYTIVLFDSYQNENDETVYPNSKALQVKMEEPSLISVNENPLPTSLSCSSDGKVTLTPSGGTGENYSYTFNGITESNNNITNLLKDTYTYSVTDANNCTVKGEVTVPGPDELVIDTVIFNAPPNSCSNGTIDIHTENVLGALSAEIIDPKDILSISIKSDTIVHIAGPANSEVIDLKITDTLGSFHCSKTIEENYIIPDYNKINLSISNYQNVKNFGTNSGNINVSINETGSCNYIYHLSYLSETQDTIIITSNSTTSKTHEFTQLDGTIDGKTYKLWVSSGESYSDTLEQDIKSPPSELAIEAVVLDTISCPGSNTGRIQINATGGWGSPYMFKINEEAWTTSNLFDGLSKGAFVFSVKDSGEGSTSTDTIRLKEPKVVSGSALKKDIRCFGEDNGEIQLTNLSGGSGFYKWQVHNIDTWYGGTKKESLFAPDIYYIYLKDSLHANCEKVLIDTVKINEPESLTIHINDIIEPTCELDNGSISARVTGGNLMYKYEWKLNDATISKSNTCTEDNVFELLETCQNGGQYQLIVEDTLGCRRGRRFNLRSYTNPSISGAVQDSARCYNEHNGSIEIEGFNSSTYDVDSLLLSNEETAYADTITNWESVMKFSGLAAGQYALTISDQEGCHSNTPWVISVFEPDSLYLLTDTIRPVIDKGESSGIIRGRVFNGNPGLKYMTLMPDTAPGTVTDTLRAINERPYAFRNINAGTYLIQTADHKGCTFMSSPLVVTEPEEALDFKVISRQDALCKAMTGSFEVQGTGGWGDYEYKRIIENAPVDNEAGFTNLQSFDGLSAGSYIVTIKDALGATFKDTVLILSPTEFLHASAEDIVHPSCGNDGRFNVAIGGGTAPYKLSFINSADTIQASGEAPVEYTNRPAGAYTLMISDDMGCHFNLETELTNDSLLTIEQPLQSGYPTAPGRSNGWLLANATGGNQPLTWQWSDGKTGLPISDGNSRMLEGIPSGYYEIAVSDAGDCSQTESFYLSDIHDGVMEILEIHGETSWQAANGFVRLLSPLLPIDSIEIVHPDKSIEILESMNELPAGYSLQEDTLTVEDIMPGDWLISAFYPDGTKAVAQFDIDAYEELTFSDIKVTHTLEYGDAKGRIEANISGGIGPFEYRWEGLTGHLRLADINHFSNKSIADHLVAGSYLLTVTDQYDNQISTENIVLGPEKPLELEIAEYENEKCKNARNAYVRVNASGGWGEYQYRHDDAQTFQNGSAWMELPPREHTFYLIDKRGAEREVSIFITEPDSLRAAVSLIDSVKCYGNANGAISFDISGGTAPYKFITDNQEELWTTDTTATDLTAGTYTFIFSDANNCVGYDTLTTTVHEPQPLEFSRINVIHTTCNTDNGAMAVSMQGGTAPYYYEWMDASGAEISTSDSISGLAQGGFYSVNVSDQNNCPQYLEQTINPSTNPAITEIETTPVLCYGDSNGKAKVVSVEAANPDAPYGFIWSDNQEGASADGFEAGTHYVTVRDTNLCESTRYFEVKTPDTLGINILEIRDAHCYGYNDGLIRLEAKGGVGQYEFSWSNGDSTATASNLAKGGYSVLINDSNDCVFEQGFVIDEPQMETVDAGEDILMCPGNAITIDGKNFAAHLWTAEGDTLSNERYFTVDSEGAFFLKVTNYRGCFAYDTINVEIGNDALKADFLMTSEAFLNDTLEIFEISNLPLDSMTWEYDVDIFSDQTPAIADDYVLHLKTLQTGMYNVTLYAYSGGCFSNMAKQVEIIEGDGSQMEDEIMGYQDPLIKSFIVSPNPNPGNFSVEVELRETAEIHLAVFSVTEGIKIDDKSNTGMDEYHERFTMNGINTGVYVVVLTVEGERRQVKIVVE